MRAIPTGAAGVKRRLECLRQLRCARPHRPRQADDLGRPLALHPQTDQQPGNLGRLGAPLHDLVHGRRRLGGGEVLTTVQFFEQCGEHQSSRKLRNSRCPSDVSTDSGWNWTP